MDWINELNGGQWMTIVSAIVSAILFILTCVFQIQAKVVAIKLQAQNEKLQEQSLMSEAEFQKKELALRAEYDSKLDMLRKQISCKIDDQAAKAQEKADAQTRKIAGDIDAAQASIDQIIHPGR